MPRKPVTDPHKAWNIAHHKRLEAYNKRIEALLNRAIAQSADLAMRHGAKATADIPFSYSQDRQLKAETEQLLKDLADDITNLTMQAETKEWQQAYRQAMEYLSSIYDVAKQTEAMQALFDERLVGMKARNLEALRAFQERKIGGLKLSDKVWDYTKDFERQMEASIDMALLEGKSAEALSRDIRSLLTDPDALFRRVRDKDTGELRMSRAMAAFHPGPGKYRSAYKNAMRLARSEINMAYRSSDSQTAQEFDACVGIRVNLSNNHTCNGKPFVDICDELEGNYPRDFKFVGWHPQCYDDQSEVYTAEGWKFFKDVKDDDLILSLNPETRDLEYVGITLNISRQHKGKMVHFHNRSYSQLVTPEHEVLVVSKNDGWTFKRIEAELCGKSQPIYRSSEWKGKKIDSVKIGTHNVKFALFATFMGYWLSDGSLGHRYEIGIAQQDADRSRIYDCIAEMGMKPRYNGGKIEFNDKDWYEYLSQFGKAADKFVPSEIKESDKSGIRVFLDAFISCDGHIKKAKPFVGSHGNLCVPKDGERVYCTSSKRMASDLGELILKTGNRPSYHVSHTAGKQQEFRNGVYTINYDGIRISECRSQYATQYKKDLVDYDGMVYDLTLERNNTMYIRRNGKCFWGSNCRCFITYILKTDEEFWRDLENGENNKSVNTVDDVPDNFKKWVNDNEERIARSEKRGTLPYFLRDNKVYWGYIETQTTPMISTDTPKLSIQERAAIRHAARTQEEIDRIKAAWHERLEISELDNTIKELKDLSQPKRIAGQSYEQYYNECLDYAEKCHGIYSDIGKKISFWRSVPATTQKEMQRRADELLVKSPIPKGMSDFKTIINYSTDNLPWYWRKKYAEFVDILNTNSTIIKEYGVYGFQDKLSHMERQSLVNMIKLSTNDNAIEFGLDKISWKTPWQFFTDKLGEEGECYLMPSKKFFDSLKQFVPLEVNPTLKACQHSGGVVQFATSKYAMDRVAHSTWQAEKVGYHEFTHANDYLRGWSNNSDVVKKWDDFVKKVNNTEYGEELRAKIEEWAAKADTLTGNQKEQLCSLSDVFQAVDSKHRKIYGWHKTGYYDTKEPRIKEYLAHCAECYWKGNSLINEIDKELHGEMIDMMSMLLEKI